MIQKFLQVASFSDVKQSKNGGPYIVVKFTPKYMLKDGTPVVSTIAEGTRTVFGAHKDANGKEFKADGLYKSIAEGTCKVGTLIEGQFVRVVTTPYTIPGGTRPVTQYTCALFAEENLVETVNKQLKNKYACMMNGDTLTAPDQCNKPVNAGEFVAANAEEAL